MTEREQFEKWATEEGWRNFTRINEGYAVDHLDDAWIAWQASRRAALEEAIAACNGVDLIGADDCIDAIRALSGPTET